MQQSTLRDGSDTARQFNANQELLMFLGRAGLSSKPFSKTFWTSYITRSLTLSRSVVVSFLPDMHMLQCASDGVVTASPLTLHIVLCRSSSRRCVTSSRGRQI